MLPFPADRIEASAHQTDALVEPFDRIQFAEHLKNHADCAELIEIVRSTEELVRLARALVPVLGAPSWLLDGIFVGATRGRALRNAALVATLAYLATDWRLRPWGNSGVWTALLASYVYRAISLGVCLPMLLRQTANVTVSEPVSVARSR